MRKIPCQIVAGPLGVGKTTTILNYLRKQAGKERIAILVNDFGPAGVDQTILAQDGQATPPLEVVAVPGGCLCCTAPIYFEQGIQQLSARDDVDRILIEPSGIVLLEMLNRQLREMATRLPIAPADVVTLLPPGRVKEQQYKTLPYYRQMVDEANYLVANFSDRASPDDLAHFREWTAQLTPPKKGIYVTTQGEIPAEVFSSSSRPTPAQGTASSPHPHHHHSHSPRRGQWEAPSSVTVSLARLESILRSAQQETTDTLLRCKGVIHTDRGWMLLQWTPDVFHISPFPAQPQSRLEWIVQEEGSLIARLKQVLPNEA